MHKRRSLKEFTAEEVVKFCEQSYINYWRCVGASQNADFSEGRITQCITGVPQDVFNVVLKCDLDQGEINARIDDTVKYCRSRRVPFLWHAGPLSSPRDIGSYLEARGFPNDYDLAAMAVDLDSRDESPYRPTDVSVRIVASSDDCRCWAECLASSWESPREAVPWMLQNACFNTSLEQEAGISLPRRMYLGLLKGRPVSVAMLVWDDDIAGLEMIGTVHHARNKGVVAAVIRTVLADARAMGFRFVVVLSTIEGLRLYEKCGFSKFGKLPEHSIGYE